MSGNDLKVFNNQPAPAPVCGQSGQRRKFANEMIRSSDIFAISSTAADLREPEAFLSQGNSDCIEMPKYRQQRAKSKKGKVAKTLVKLGTLGQFLTEEVWKYKIRGKIWQKLLNQKRHFLELSVVALWIVLLVLNKLIKPT